jgi:hypothetical protein
MSAFIQMKHGTEKHMKGFDFHFNAQVELQQTPNKYKSQPLQLQWQF